MLALGFIAILAVLLVIDWRLRALVSLVNLAARAELGTQSGSAAEAVQAAIRPMKWDRMLRDYLPTTAGRTWRLPRQEVGATEPKA